MIPETAGDCALAAAVTGKTTAQAGTGWKMETAGTEERAAETAMERETPVVVTEEKTENAGTGERTTAGKTGMTAGKTGMIIGKTVGRTTAGKTEKKTTTGKTTGRMTAAGAERKTAAVRRISAGKTADEVTETAIPSAKKADGAVMAGFPRSGMCAVTEACARAEDRNSAADLLRRNAGRKSKAGKGMA